MQLLLFKYWITKWRLKEVRPNKETYAEAS